MNKKIMNLWKRTAALVLAFALVLVGVCLNGTMVRAESLSSKVNASAYSLPSAVNYTPDSTWNGEITEAYYDRIFAGFYTDETLEEAVSDDWFGSDSIGYVKWLQADVLSVACQVNADLTAESDTAAIRFITTIDALTYSSISFDLTIGVMTISVETSFVFTVVQAYDVADLDAVSIDPSVIADDSVYFAAYTLYNIPQSAFETGIKVTPYLTTLDGTVVAGITRYVHVEDSYNNYVNVGIRLLGTDELAAGLVTLYYDSDVVSFVGVNGELEADMFEELTFLDDGEGTIKILGNVEDITEGVFGGLLASLRFAVIGGTIDDSTFVLEADMGSETDFGSAFCNIYEELTRPEIIRAVCSYYGGDF